MASDVKQRRTHKELPMSDHLDPFSTPSLFFKHFISETKSCSVCRISSAQWATISCTKPHGHLEKQNHNHAQTSQLSAFVNIVAVSFATSTAILTCRCSTASHPACSQPCSCATISHHPQSVISGPLQRKPVSMAMFQEYESSELNNLHYRPWSGKSKPINRRNAGKC
ncbi:hypothetical protein E4T47_08347 [Aureobasidium subglaciale]|nr:hypothetical protein E4T43_07046 [Aureobasidium subglaciale]KAI5266172.1 hypothetical protein E4T47_08347 [Aureobasidium subglaciale]